MTSLRLLPLAFLLVVSVQARAAPPTCPWFFPGGQPPSLVNPKLDSRTTLLCNDAYAALASGTTHGALWSAKYPTAASLEAARGIGRVNDFHPDDRLPVADQAQVEDYRRSGYDRGHMTPSGDMPDAIAQDQSFSLANMVPQTPQLNRGIWEGIESAVRRLAERQGELFLVTGPAFAGEALKSIGPDSVLVPSSTWKAVYDPGAGEAGVYVCKNTATPTCVVTSVAALVQAVGIDPFPALSPATKATAMALPQPEANPYAHGGHRRRRRERGETPATPEP